MNIEHRPIFDIDRVKEAYGDVSYVMTTEQNGNIGDIYFQETPHPTYGNRYFGLFPKGKNIFITNAEYIEGMEFAMIEVDGKWRYSVHRHDYIQTENGVIDGGRDYIRGYGYTLFTINDGKIKALGQT